MVACILNTAEIVMLFVPSLLWETLWDTVPSVCVPVPDMEDEVKDLAVPPMVQVLLLLPIPRLQSLIRYILQVIVEAFADTSCAWLQSTFSL
jgi:hypothetical protein